MRPRTLVGILVALVLVIVVSYLSHQNVELLTRRFALTEATTMPVFGLLVMIFLAGLLPGAGILLVQTLKRDLAQRRQRQLDRESQSRRGSFRRAVDFQEDQQWERAAAELESLLPDQGEDFGTLFRYGHVLRHLGRTEEALEVHRRLSVLYPRSAAVLYELAEDYEAAGEPEVARQVRDRLLRDFKGVGQRELRRRRNAAVGAGDWAAAGSIQERLEALTRDTGGGAASEEAGIRQGLDYQRAVAMLEERRLVEARKIFRRLLEADAGFVPARIMLGEAALLDHDPEAAVAEWVRGFQATRRSVFLDRIEDHFIDRGEPLPAIELLRSLIARYDDDPVPRFYLGRLYYRLEMHEEALKILEGVDERLHAAPDYNCLVGRIRERRGEMGQAVEFYRRCLEQSGYGGNEYGCRVCGARRPAWQARCHACGAWDTLEKRVLEEPVPGDELGAPPGTL